MDRKEILRQKKRIVIKVGTTTITYEKTGNINLEKLEKFVRILINLRNKGKEVIVVSSGAVGVGRAALGLDKRPDTEAAKQACAAVGQARLMMTYQKMFSEYHQTAAQILMTKGTMLDNVARKNAQNTFEELFRMGIIPVVNENDTISTYEMQFGDNDTLSALVASLVGADLLILLSDIDGLFTDDPHQNPDARLIEMVDELDGEIEAMAKGSTGSDVGTGGMEAKLTAARIATLSGADMVIANGEDVGVLHRIFEGNFVGTVFRAHYDEDFYIADFIEKSIG